MRFADTTVLLYAVSTSQDEHGLTHEDAAALVDAFARFPVAATTLPLVRAALETKERFQLSYWDSAILEAARTLGCEVVLSEDLDDRTDYDGVRVENPFAAA